jgi:hypothetical protein
VDPNRVYAEGTLGSLVAWFKTECPRWDKLSDATRKDYQAAFDWLEPEFDCPLELITTPSLYDARATAVPRTSGRGSPTR